MTRRRIRRCLVLAAVAAVTISLAASGGWRETWSIRLTTSEVLHDGVPESLSVTFENRGDAPLIGSNASFSISDANGIHGWAEAPSLRHALIELRPGERTTWILPWSSLVFTGLRGEPISSGEIQRAMSTGTWRVVLTVLDESTPKPDIESNLTVWSNEAKLGDYAALQGAWDMAQGRKLVFDGERVRRDGDRGAAPFALDESTEPKRIDLGDGATRVKGIYTLEGDDLMLCLAAPGADRPASFEGAGTILTVARRRR